VENVVLLSNIKVIIQYENYCTKLSMDKRMRHTFLIMTLILSVSFLSLKCKDDVISPPPTKEEPQWRLIPQFATLDIRYMLQKDGALYVVADDPNVTQVDPTRKGIYGQTYLKGEKGLIFSTIDAVTWTKIKSFNIEAGPLTFHGDTMYCLASDSIFRCLPNGQWQAAFATPPRLSYAPAVGDIVFDDSSLIAMFSQNTYALQTWRIYPNSSYRELLVDQGIYQYSGAKFLKHEKFGQSVIYVRPHWIANGFFKLVGDLFMNLTDGLSYDETHSSSPSNSMAIHNDTLFAGFKYPGNIKIMNDPAASRRVS
jgi:hypothetical protein